MINFTNCEVNKFRAYGGANGNKINVIYDSAGYMLKFPPIAKVKSNMSYSNSCISEYIACKIFNSIGIKTQETLLGTYIDKKGKEKVVVACRDFTENTKKLIEFAQLKNTCIDSEQNGYGKELSSIMDAINEQDLIPSEKLKEFFWDMFITDALLGNFDRHNGNWGILVDEENQTASIAPVYDCGSCLYAQLDVKGMEKVLKNEKEIDERIYTFPRSAIEEDGKKISYFDYISSHKNPDCTNALKRVYPKINLGKINEIIDNTETICDIQKDFYKNMVKERYDKIIDHSMDLVQKPRQTFEMRMF